jgi:predicted nucleotidyltransferase
MPKRELTHLKLPEKYLTVLCQLLKDHVPDAEVWAYGSRVTGNAHECSDLDIVLRNPNQLSLGCEGRSALEEALRESLIPVLVDTHDWAYLPKSFYPNIEREYVVLQKPARAK